jgi:hypothetical protein
VSHESRTSKSEEARKQFINNVTKYRELVKLQDLARAATLGDPDERSSLVSMIGDIFDDDLATMGELKEDLHNWYGKLADSFYSYCDDLAKEEGLSLIGSVDGATFQPPIDDIARVIWRKHHGRRKS